MYMMGEPEKASTDFKAFAKPMALLHWKSPKVGLAHRVMTATAAGSLLDTAR